MPATTSQPKPADHPKQTVKWGATQPPFPATLQTISVPAMEKESQFETFLLIKLV
jgi:hypothetical protein